MINRTNSLSELENRIIADYSSIGIKTFRRYPGISAREDEIPCLFMFEGPDKIIKISKSSLLGYPKQRKVEVIFELIDFKSDIVSKITGLRSSLLLPTPRLVEGSFIEESYIEGPIGYGIDNIVVCRIVFDMTYNDNNI